MKTKIISLSVLCFFLLGQATVFSDETVGIGAEKALGLLKEGNERYVQERVIHPNAGIEKRKEVAASQHPFAVIVGCSDSRVPPEIVFDRGIGDLFVVRVAGNVVGDIEIGSVEYAAEHLGSQLVVVLGHKRCGAVTAAAKGGEMPGHLDSIVDRIEPAVEKVKGRSEGDIENIVKENVKLVSERLSSSEPVLEELVKENKLKIVGAYYDLDTGAVEFMPED